MNFNDRLKSLLGEKGLIAAELAKLSGIPPAIISLWLKGGTEPNGRNLVKASIALRVCPEWLLEGTGAKEWGTKVQQAECEDRNYPVSKVKINFSDGTRKFTTESIGDNMTSFFFPVAWYTKNKYLPNELFAIAVTGSAMEPALYDGDWVVINTADTTPKEGAVFVIHGEGEAVIRRLFKINNQWLAASDNPDKRLYRDKPITEDVFIIGRVVHKQSERI